MAGHQGALVHLLHLLECFHICSSEQIKVWQWLIKDWKEFWNPKSITMIDKGLKRILKSFNWYKETHAFRVGVIIAV